MTGRLRGGLPRVSACDLPALADAGSKRHGGEVGGATAERVRCGDGGKQCTDEGQCAGGEKLGVSEQEPCAGMPVPAAAVQVIGLPPPQSTH
jgi:hypothetical protein